ncbi:MAG: HlyD family efflux transporter periplasmic adaptor subunit [Phycisphaerae bacterium]|nr:HlyD family efflux transporter periplasmic adaptor subunit [Phycisphaerae bacterium]
MIKMRKNTRRLLVLFLLGGVGAINSLSAQSDSVSSGYYPSVVQAQSVVVLSSSVDALVVDTVHGPQDYVSKGENMITMDSDVIEMEIESLEAQRELSTVHKDAAVRLQYARDNLEIVEKLRKIEIADYKGASSKEVKEARQAFDLAQLGKTKADLEMKMLNLKLKNARKQLKLHSIEAPVSGVVVPFKALVKELGGREPKRVEVGEMVVRGQPPIAMIKVDRLRVDKLIPAVHIDKMRLGQSASVFIKGSGTNAIDAKVVYISPYILATGDFRIEVEFDNPRIDIKDKPAGTYPFKFRHKMKARVEIEGL